MSSTPPTDPPPERDPLHKQMRPVHAESDQLAATVTAYILTGPALFGGLGLLADHWLGTGFLVLIGMLAGAGMALYVIWLRYGSP